MDDLVSEFVAEAAESLAGLQRGLGRLIADSDDRAGAREMARRLHGLKGVCGFIGFARAEALAHAAEGLFAAVAEAETRVSSVELACGADALARLAAILAHAADHGLELEAEDADLVAALECGAVRLRGGQTRVSFGVGAVAAPALPLQLPEDRRARAPWVGLDAFARGLGDRLGKRIDLAVGGDNLRFAADAIGPLRTALIALVRNACDHGVEPPAERRAGGKPPMAVLHLTVRRTLAGAAIDLADDGRGVDPARIRACCAEAQGLDDTAAQALVFAPGVSTAEAVTTLSGRGLGLELVRREVEALGGSIEMSSTPGRGARFTIEVPDAVVAAAASRRKAAA